MGRILRVDRTEVQAETLDQWTLKQMSAPAGTREVNYF
jgi:hypothetical protein